MERDAEEGLHWNFERARDFALAALSGTGRGLDFHWSSLVDAISEINAIVERNAHPDDVGHARLAVHALLGLWLNEDEVDALFPGDVPRMCPEIGSSESLRRSDEVS